MLSSGVTSCSKTRSIALDFSDNFEPFDCLLSPLLDLALLAALSPAHVPARDGGKGYSCGSLRAVDALESGARLLEALLAMLSPAHVPARESGRGYSSGSL